MYIGKVIKPLEKNSLSFFEKKKKNVNGRPCPGLCILWYI